MMAYLMKDENDGTLSSSLAWRLLLLLFTLHKSHHLDTVTANKETHSSLALKSLFLSKFTRPRMDFNRKL